jgi:hypothetical protein
MRIRQAGRERERREEATARERGGGARGLMNIMLVGCEARVTTTRPDKDATSEARKDRRDSGGAGGGGRERTSGSNSLKNKRIKEPPVTSPLKNKGIHKKTSGSGTWGKTRTKRTAGFVSLEEKRSASKNRWF